MVLMYGWLEIEGIGYSNKCDIRTHYKALFFRWPHDCMHIVVTHGVEYLPLLKKCLVNAVEI